MKQGTLPIAMPVADPRRPRPYVWASWLTKLLAGEDACWWRAWYKAHHKYAKQADDPERADFFKKWTATHDGITARRAAWYQAQGWVVRVEAAGEFKLHGAQADLAGKPDLVAMRDSKAIVEDAKAGKRRASDHWQVLLYMFALPLVWLKDHTVAGQVAYSDGLEPVRPLGKGEREAIIQAMRKVSGPEAPAPAPSPMECRYCDVANCPSRYQAPQGDATELW